jgi:hypothetical protein
MTTGSVPPASKVPTTAASGVDDRERGSREIGPVHLAHPATAEQRLDPVGAEHLDVRSKGSLRVGMPMHSHR